jgi:hypothetical protein
MFGHAEENQSPKHQVEGISGWETICESNDQRDEWLSVLAALRPYTSNDAIRLRAWLDVPWRERAQSCRCTNQYIQRVCDSPPEKEGMARMSNMPASRLLLIAATTLAAFVLAPLGTSAVGSRQWSVSLGGPDRVAPGRDYIYTVALTNDDGVWPSSNHTQSPLRLTFDLRERYGEGPVGIEDILVHPAGPQAPDGSFPCDTRGGCSFHRAGSRIDFSFTRDNVKVAPVTFDIIIHTASVFRPGDASQISATLQGEWNETSGGDSSPYAADGSIGGALLATFPDICGESSGDCLTESIR